MVPKQGGLGFLPLVVQLGRESGSFQWCNGCRNGNGSLQRDARVVPCDGVMGAVDSSGCGGVVDARVVPFNGVMGAVQSSKMVPFNGTREWFRAMA
jgi:hypothetical protein